MLLVARKKNWIGRQLELLPRMSAPARAIVYVLFLSRYIRLVTTDEDNKRLKTELSEMKARHRLEIERVTREKEQEMDEVHKRFVMDDLFACELQIIVVGYSENTLTCEKLFGAFCSGRLTFVQFFQSHFGQITDNNFRHFLKQSLLNGFAPTKHEFD